MKNLQNSGFVPKSPILILFIVVIAVFISEILVMVLLHYVPIRDTFGEVITDSLLLIILITPVLYFFLFKPMVTHIRDREKIEAVLLNNQEEQFKKMAQASIDGFGITDSQARFLEVNDAYCKMTGYSRKEFLNMRISDVEVIEKPEETAAHIKKLLETGSDLFETHHRCKDGRILDIEVSANYSDIPDVRIFCFLRDITMRKKAEEALRANEARLQATLDNSPYMIWQKDTDGRYIAFNQPFIKVLGQEKPQEVLGKTDLDLWPKELAEKYRADDIEVMASRQQKVVEERAVKDGQIYWVETCKTPIVDAHGKLLGTTGFAQDITGRRQYEDALKASEERWSFALEGGGYCVWEWNLQTGEVMLSKVGAQMFGFTEDEAGNNIEEWRKRTHQDDVVRINEDLRAYLHGQTKNFATEYRVLCKDGGWKWILSRGMLVSRTQEGKPLRMIGTHADITERREREEAARLARTVFTSVDNAVVVTDPDNNIIEVNPAFTAITGYSAGEVIGKNPRIFSSGMHPPAFYRDMWEALTTTGRWRGEVWNRRKNGEIYVESVSINLIHDEKNSLTHHVAVFSDITERQQYIDGLCKAQQLAEEIAKTKSNFIANMSHEIRTPMNAIIGLSQLALNKQISSEVRGYLEKILNSSDSLLDILNDILDLSKVEAGRMTIEQNNFDLNIILKNLDSLFAARAEDKFLDFSIEVLPDVPRNLVGDALRLQQVLSNLLGNALKFTEHGKVTLKIGIKQTSNEQATLLFCVEDTGIGIAKENIVKLFQPFSQVDNSISRRFGGTGLGLSISHTLLQLMGSDISVESTPGKGTTFSFELVLGITTQTTPHEAARYNRYQEAGALSSGLRDRGQLLAGARILVAEDDTINQQVAREFLELSGITVVIANNGKEMLELLDQGPFDAVLMDVHMPVMDGIEATRRIRAQPRFAHLPIIALTADIASEGRENYLSGGMNDFIAKPIHPEQLITALLRWVEPNEKAAMAPETGSPETARPGYIPPQAESNPSMDNLPDTVLSTDEGFDLDNILGMLNGNQQQLIELLLSFMDGAVNIPSEIETKAMAGDLHAARGLAHRLSGTAANLGAKSLHAVAKQLECELKADQFNPATFAAFHDEFKRAMSAIAGLRHDPLPEQLPSPQPSPQSSPASGRGDKREEQSSILEALMRAALKLDTLLEENDYVTDEPLNEFKANLPPGKLEQFAVLRKHIKNIQYAKARQVLRTLVGLPDTQEL